VNDYTKELLVELSMPKMVRDLGLQDMTIPLESYKNFWRKANEKISSYPSALSFATMKAGATDELIAELECDLINIALSTGYSPECWQHLLDVMILKNRDKLSFHLFILFAYSLWTATMHLNM
jgi:hypothetical protein